MSSRSEEAILRQTSCVMCVCAYACVCVLMFVCMVTQLQAELGILNYHISTSREKPKGYTHMPVHKHTYTHVYTRTHTPTHSHMHTYTPPPHISGTAGPLLRSSNTPTEGGGWWWWWCCGLEEEGRAVGLWRSVRLVSDIETKVKHKPPVLLCYSQRCVTDRSLRMYRFSTARLMLLAAPTN